MLQRHILSLSKYANMSIMIIIAVSVTFNILLRRIILDNSLPAEFLPDFAFANSLLHLDFTTHSLPAPHLGERRHESQWELMKQARQTQSQEMRKWKTCSSLSVSLLSVYIHWRLNCFLQEDSRSRPFGMFEWNSYSYSTKQTWTSVFM